MIEILLAALKPANAVLDAFSRRSCFGCKQGLASKENQYFCLSCLSFLQRGLYDARKVVAGHKIFFALDYAEFVQKYMRDFKYHNPFLLLFWVQQLQDFVLSNFQYIFLPEIINLLESNLKRNKFKIKIVLLGIPMHQNRKALRKYNQAELLAKELSCKLQQNKKNLRKQIYDFLGEDLTKDLQLELDFVYQEDVLQRIKDTPSLYDKSKEERQQIMQGAFGLQFEPKGKDSICLLVDDITTTGTTLIEAKKTLNFPRTVLLSACGRISDENFT